MVLLKNSFILAGKTSLPTMSVDVDVYVNENTNGRGDQFVDGSRVVVG